MITKVNKSIIIFCIFAFGFLLSNLVRSITATLTPVLTYEFDLTAGNLGLLAGGYFIGFSIMQVPIGLLLDKFGPKKVVGYFLIIALVGTISFALAKSFSGLLVSRIFIGIGVSACMMGPLTGYRVWFAEKYQQRANSWMLMVANIGFVSSTLPVQILLPYMGPCKVIKFEQVKSKKQTLYLLPLTSKNLLSVDTFQQTKLCNQSVVPSYKHSHQYR